MTQAFPLPGHLLIIGGGGRLGRTLAAAARDAGVRVTATTRHPHEAGPGAPLLDLAGDAGGFRPPAGVDAAVLCAAVTDLRRCAADPALARRVNHDGALAVAAACRDAGIFTVFPSTNLVFDGTRPFRRTGEAPCPLTPYGRLKAAAEEALLAAGGTAVLRLTKVLDPALPLTRGWAAALGAGRPVRAFHDMVLAPVGLGHAARALLALAGARQAGVAHLSGEKDLTYHALACAMAARLGMPAGLVEAASRRDAGIGDEAAPAHTTLAMDGLSVLTGTGPIGLERVPFR